MGNLTSILVDCIHCLVWNKWQNPIGDNLFSF
jgi:hypothetical protein